jgi:lichenan operon transcriptional antiterminator
LPHFFFIAGNAVLMNHPAAINALVESKDYHEFYYTLKRVLGRRKQSE